VGVALGVVQGGGDEYAFYFVGLGLCVCRLWVSLRTPTYPLRAEKVAAAAHNEGLLDIRLAKTEAEVAALWKSRKALSRALRKVAPKKINEDVVVPVTEMSALIIGLDELSTKYQLPIVNFGHAGNGNIHVNLLLNPDDPEQSHKANACLDEIFSLVLSLKGTLSGEHGVGIEKRDFVDRELDANSIELMRAIKRQFDPKGILNQIRYCRCFSIFVGLGWLIANPTCTAVMKWHIAFYCIDVIFQLRTD
jgi:FAD/FMN-containing dehydrogenase